MTNQTATHTLHKIPAGKKFRYEIRNSQGIVIHTRSSARHYVAATINNEMYFGRLDLVGKASHGKRLQHLHSALHDPNHHYRKFHEWNDEDVQQAIDLLAVAYLVDDTMPDDPEPEIRDHAMNRIQDEIQRSSDGPGANEVITQKPTLDQYEAQLHDKDCKWCRRADWEPGGPKTVSLADQPVEHYNHPGGHPLHGHDELQWMFVTCPGCGYQWSLGKLHLPDFATLQK